MIDAMTHAGALLLQAAGTFPDTLFTKPVAPVRGWFEQLTGIASGLVSITLLVLTIALVPAAWNFRKSYKKVSELLDKIYGDVNPLMKHASTVADNLDYITTSVRVDMQRVNQTIAVANQKLREAVELTETRLQEFNALMKVVQQEAEDTFVTTASVVRGVRKGMQALDEETRGQDAARLTRATELDDDWIEGEDDGDDSTTAAADRRAGPRIRSRET
ncbi:MAG TPA: hypothetical protein VF761_06905 [Gemmatimonadaceae bacterium]